MTLLLFIEQVLNGLQAGVMLFLMAAGLTLIFGVMGLINLAHGSLYMVGAFAAAATAAATGSFVLALIASMAAAAAAGALVEVTVIRRLYARDHLDQVLATFALILIFSEGTRWLFGSFPLYLDVPAALAGPVTLPGGIEYPAYRLLIIAVGLVTAGFLFWLIARTRIGIQIRAGESDREMIAALGVDISKLYTVVFALGAALAGLAGAMVGAIQSVQVGMGEPVLILAFVVIVIGGIGSIKGALVGALLVGLTDTLGGVLLPAGFRLITDPATANNVGASLASMSIYILMAGVLLVRPTGLFGGADVRAAALNAALLAMLPLTALAALMLDAPFIITLATKVAILALAAVGLNIALGLGGLVSLGHAAFFGIGGYAMGILAHHAQTFTPLMEAPLLIEGTKSMPVIWLVAVLSSALAALAIGALSLRTTGVYFIMITLAFGQMFYYFTIGWTAYGGEDGLSIYVRNDFPGLNTLVPIQFFGLCFAVLAAVLWLASRLERSGFGLALTAARQSAPRVETVGLVPYRLRLIAFTISGAITGLAGALFADLNRFVSPTMFSWQTSGEIMIFIILGGVGRLFGPVAGAALFILLEHLLGGVSDYWLIYVGALLLAVVLFARGGLIGTLAGRQVAHD